MGGRILVIDGEEKMRKLLERVFSRTGFEVESTDSQTGAIDLVREKNFQLAIIGLSMPAVDVIGFMKSLGKAGYRNKCILLMEYPGIHLLMKEIEQGVVAILMKPCDLNEIERSVLEAMESQ